MLLMLGAAALAWWYLNRAQPAGAVTLPAGGYVPGGNVPAVDPYAGLIL